ncbi:hypothetical protein jhhlp_006586 [Lomentospora prolificans]|uniref:Uncharacterized protein n=1 Tax=Lomentospora prolificans TaxID=41688 RepID=A0A2N3N6D9_9PEZI|nr:hypothetical protein jhhlp_006586 [Lomentospora prolificans]
MPQITTLLFDCDNTLVLSEELAFAACADIINGICKGQQVDKSFTGESLISEFVGQNFRGMLGSLQQRYGIKLTPEELESYVTAEEDAVIAKIKAEGRPCVGVMEQLEKLEASGKYKLAVVSSSAKRRVLASIEKVGQSKYFPDDDVFSAATSLPTPTSKPDPAVYLHAMKVLGKKPEECVAIEDSKSGTTSGARAGIKVLGYTGPYPAEKKAEMAKVLTDAGAVVVMDDWSEFPEALAKIEAL